MSQTTIPGQAVPIGAVDDAQVRFEFMTRVYGYLGLGIAGFVGLEWALFATGLAYDIYDLVLSTSWLLILGGFMLLTWLSGTFVWKVRSQAAQLALYGVVVLAEALIFAAPLVIAAQTAPEAIFQAGAISLVAFAGLSGVAITSSKDFSFLGAILKWVGVAALVLIVSAVVFGLTLGTWFSVGMIVFAGAAILWETQTILRHYPQGAEIPAAIGLFTSLALMFWYVLRLLTRR